MGMLTGSLTGGLRRRRFKSTAPFHEGVFSRDVTVIWGLHEPSKSCGFCAGEPMTENQQKLYEIADYQCCRGTDLPGQRPKPADTPLRPAKPMLASFEIQTRWGTVLLMNESIVTRAHGGLMTQAMQISEDVVRRVIGSLGFPADRVDRALFCLLNDGSEIRNESRVRRLLSFQEVQRTLGISKSGLRRIVEAGYLAPVDLTKHRIGFIADDVDAFIMSRKRGHQ